MGLKEDTITAYNTLKDNITALRDEYLDFISNQSSTMGDLADAIDLVRDNFDTLKDKIEDLKLDSSFYSMDKEIRTFFMERFGQGGDRMKKHMLRFVETKDVLESFGSGDTWRSKVITDVPELVRTGMDRIFWPIHKRISGQLARLERVIARLT
jgi:uncharacterized protein (DUF2267 family)